MRWSVDDLDDAVAAALDQDSMAVHDGVACSAGIILLQDVVVAHARRRQNGADADVADRGMDHDLGSRIPSRRIRGLSTLLPQVCSVPGA